MKSKDKKKWKQEIKKENNRIIKYKIWEAVSERGGSQCSIFDINMGVQEEEQWQFKRKAQRI